MEEYKKNISKILNKTGYPLHSSDVIYRRRKSPKPNILLNFSTFPTKSKDF
jgi:hypothetical protein